MPNKIIVILGPTCTGKTSLAIRLCKRYNGSIISADSRQVVRYMDIGTGKIPSGELDWQIMKSDDKWVVGGADIYGYDLIDPDGYFSAYDFIKHCQKILPRISREGRNAFLVGGTGFYIDAVTSRVSFKGGGPDFELREVLSKESVEELGYRLMQLDKNIYESIDKKNPARLVRAVEKAMKGSEHNKIVDTPVIERAVHIGLTAKRDVLYGRADKWVDSVFNDKLFNEVELIIKRFPKSHRLRGLVYKSVSDFLKGSIGLEEAVQRVKFDLHSYIRRQQTWFKRNPEIKWLDISKENFDSKIQSIVESVLNG